MNNLNSILIEGVVADITHDDTHAWFTVTACRYVNVRRDDGHEVERLAERITVPCEVTERLADAMKANLRIGRGVRVVGHLRTLGGELGICAEHVELRPEAKQA
jgi:hypothetical protein